MLRTTLIGIVGLLVATGSAHAFGTSQGGSVGVFQEGPGSSNTFWCDGPAGCVAGFAGYGVFGFVDESSGFTFLCANLLVFAQQFSPAGVQMAAPGASTCVSADPSTGSASVVAQSFTFSQADLLGVPFSFDVQDAQASANPGGASASTQGNTPVVLPHWVDWNVSASGAGPTCVSATLLTSLGPASAGPFCL